MIGTGVATSVGPGAATLHGAIAIGPSTTTAMGFVWGEPADLTTGGGSAAVAAEVVGSLNRALP